MIELPEAAVIARQAARTLTGKQISHVLANASPHKFAWYTGDPAHYPDLLVGKTIHAAVSFGNHVQIHAGDMRLVISTPIKYHIAGEKPPAKHQLFLEFTDGTSLSCTVQMWGGMLCLAPGEKASMIDYPLALEKPSPLSEAFDSAYFNSLLDESTGKLSAKEFLATNQRIPGLGNGVLQDILWTACIHPRRKMGDLAEPAVQGMFEAVKKVLAAMTAGGGRDSERDLFGQFGGYCTVLSKNTAGQPCPTCGTPICKEAFMGGSIYFCPHCQVL
jgi:formamidopyrimidine-DNA glycosylase